MNICGYLKESINEGIGLRSVIFISGCFHNCDECHSPETHNFDYGDEFTIEKQLEICNDVKENPLLDGLTLCGGDPFFSAIEVLGFINLFKQENSDKTIWAYTGFTIEEIIKDRDMFNLLSKIDVLIDGKFEKDLRDVSLRFTGSTNQRIINVKEWLSK